MYGGKPDPTQILIILPNGERQLIPIEWTDQVSQIQYPPGACFVFERLVVLRQRLDHLLSKDSKQTILTANEQELEQRGDSYANRRSTNHLESDESRTTGPDHCHSGADVATSMDPGNGCAA